MLYHLPESQFLGRVSGSQAVWGLLQKPINPCRLFTRKPMLVPRQDQREGIGGPANC